MPRHPHPHDEQKCLNCGHHFRGKFCPECGQKAEVERLTAAQLVGDTIHSLTHYEKGFFHTAWHFLVMPGPASLRYLAGKRKAYQRPVSYILILTTLYIIIHNFIIDRFGYHYSVGNSKSAITFEESSNIFLRTHFTPFIFLILLASAVLVYWILARGKFNFIEILTLCLYGGGTYFMMLTISDIVLGVFFRINIISANVFIWQTAVSSVYNFWFSLDIFKRVRIRYLWPRLITVSLLVSATGWVMMNYLPLAWVALFG